MRKVKIYGSGSIGNHLAYACRSKRWDVSIFDPDSKALERTKNDIYPSRYGNWDKEINLLYADNRDKSYELVIIGTPPDTHIKLALEVLKTTPPPVLLIEKPLCTPALDGVESLLKIAEITGTKVLTGYNHRLTQNTVRATEIIKNNLIGEILTISAMFREHWGGIFAAHPWLNGPHDTYLGFSDRGGGACSEQSHAINIWQYFAGLFGAGKITEVSATMDFVENEQIKYDRLCLINVKTENGLTGNIIQDVITSPPETKLRIQGSEGFLEWQANYDSEHDAIIYSDKTGKIVKEFIAKKRPDDFKGEINHIEELLNGTVINSPISLEQGLETMMVISAAHRSHQNKKTLKLATVKNPGQCR